MCWTLCLSHFECLVLEVDKYLVIKSSFYYFQRKMMLEHRMVITLPHFYSAHYQLETCSAENLPRPNVYRIAPLHAEAALS